MSDNDKVISDEAVEAAAYLVGEAVYGDLTPDEAARLILEAAAPHMTEDESCCCGTCGL
jgi:hypothetical protein